MKEIKILGKIVKQKVEPLNCIECDYNTGCDAWGCVSPGCELTGECFHFERHGTWCPFGKIPDDKKYRNIEIISELK